MADLSTDVRYIKGIGEKKAQALNKLGVFSLFDLISFFPRRYDDRSICKPIALTMDGETVCIQCLVADEPRLTRIRRGLDLVKFHIVDDSGSVDITFFNQSYIKNAIHRGESYIFFGKIEMKGSRRSMVNPVFEKEDAPHLFTGRIVPVYRLAAGLRQRDVLQGVQQGLDACLDELPEVLPDDVRLEHNLATARYSYQNIHAPADFKALELARRRFVFEELFLLSCAFGQMRGSRIVDDGIPFADIDFSKFYASLPFSPTGAQQRAVREASADLISGKRMNRLLQGDVGSGKTLVAAALIWQAYQSGKMSAFMAPTEILAEQHFQTLQGMLSPFGLRLALLTGSLSAKEKRIVKAGLLSGEIDCVIGTHALLSDDVEYPGTLALVITDEQHRFGVEQRSSLVGKGSKPHVLVMSATPIPRTLALIIYGDLDVSLLDELPPGRQRVDTFCVDSSYRDRLNRFIRKQAEEGRQIFVVCPKVEEAEEGEESSGLLSVTEHAEMLQKTLPDLSVACIHGKMKAKEKDEIMRRVVSGEIHVLVATTVIEVGVDVPNASLMIIENADRFGLSQLHQLRGRVGRGHHKSYCVLVTDLDSEDVAARMKIMTSTTDGFKIAEEDLRLRGPGDFFGSRQHGLPEMHVADLGTDTETLVTCKQAADRLLQADPQLALPEHRLLKERIALMLERSAGSFN